MEESTKESIRMIKNMAMVYLNGRMGDTMMENGKMDFNMVKENLKLKWELK